MVKMPTVFTPLSRAEIDESYYVSGKGEILTFGPFYGCPMYAPYLWGFIVRGMYERTAEANGKKWPMVRITAEMREEYPELAGIREVGLREEKKQICHWVITETCRSPR